MSTMSSEPEREHGGGRALPAAARSAEASDLTGGKGSRGGTGRFPRALVAPAIAAGALAIAFPAGPAFAVLAALAFLAATTARPMLGWSLVALTYPFIYLQLFIGRTVNVPYVDLLAMATFVGAVLHTAYRWWRHGERPRIRPLPGIAAFVAFIAIAALSLTNAEDVGAGVKYLLRPLSFFYFMYVVLPVLVIDRPSRLFTTFRILFLVGGIAAAMGVWSLVFPPEPGAFRRAVPIAVFGVTALGTNHNLIAEVLTSVIPIGILLAAYAHGVRQRWYIVGTIAYALVDLLTFSRNGWLTLAVEATIVLVALARERGVSWRRIAARAAPLVLAAVVAVALFSTTTVARSSNRNRLRLTEIAINQWRGHPWVGGGVGTFVEAVSRDRWYLADFGSPQEAHGLIQKLLAETGALGLAAFLALLASVVAYVVRVYRRAVAATAWRMLLLTLLAAAAGSIVFQLFNTSYFVSKLWLPLGVAVAAARLAERGIALRREDAGFR